LTPGLVCLEDVLLGAVGPRRAWVNAKDGRAEAKVAVRIAVLSRIFPNRICEHAF
jgi:hypothetical protein